MDLSPRRFREVRSRFFQRFRVAPADDDARAFLEELPRRLAPDAAAAAGHQRASSLDAEIHSLLPVFANSVPEFYLSDE
ncbi:hypothetical protein D3C83_31530 [compost metagenome]